MEKCPRLKLQQQCIKYLGPVSSHLFISAQQVTSPGNENFFLIVVMFLFSVDGKESL